MAPTLDTDSFTSVVLRRLASPVGVEPGDWPTWADIGLDVLREEAKQWQFERSRAIHWEAFSGAAKFQQDRWMELGSLFGSTGETVSLAGACEIEVELIRRAIAAGQVTATYGIAQRALAEMEANFLISAAHRMTNLTARALMLEQDYPWGAVTGRSKGKLSHRTPVYSGTPTLWFQLSDIDAINAIAIRSPVPEVRALSSPVHRLWKSPEWIALVNQRGEDHHRLRFESRFVAGISRASPWVETPSERIIEVPGPTYIDADGIVDEVCLVTHNAAALLGHAMQSLREAWTEAWPALSRP